MGRAASAADVDRLSVGGVVVGRVWSAPADQTSYRGEWLPVVDVMPAAGTLAPHVRRAYARVVLQDLSLQRPGFKEFEGALGPHERGSLLITLL